MAENSVSGEYDAVVIGAGIMGSCTAYQVAKKGKSVLLLEQYDFLHRRGSSHGESRTIRITYPELYYTHMMKEAFQLWEEAQLEAGYMVFTRTGQLDFGPSDNKSLLSVLNTCKLLEIPHELLDANQVSVRFPMFNLPKDYLVVHTPQAGVLHATKAVAMFQSLAAKHGAVLRDRARVNHISLDWKSSDGSAGVLVRTSRGAAFAKKVVLAAGAWNRDLVKAIAGLHVPIQPLNTIIAYWQVDQSVANTFSPHSFPTFASYETPAIYGTPSLEYPGLLKASVHSGAPCNPDSRCLLPDLELLQKHVSPWLSSIFYGKVRSEVPALAECCMYSMTPDQDFILDYLPCSPENNILLAGGFSGHGFKMGPLIGRVMADLALTGKCTGVDLDFFSFNRFFQNPKGNQKDYEEPVALLQTFSDLVL